MNAQVKKAKKAKIKYEYVLSLTDVGSKRQTQLVVKQFHSRQYRESGIKAALQAVVVNRPVDDGDVMLVDSLMVALMESKDKFLSVLKLSGMIMACGNTISGTVTKRREQLPKATV